MDINSKLTTLHEARMFLAGLGRMKEAEAISDAAMILRQVDVLAHTFQVAMRDEEEENDAPVHTPLNAVASQVVKTTITEGEPQCH